MSRLSLSLACGPYDRTRALADGRVTVAGVDLRYLELSPEEIFFRMISYGEFDIAELSLSTYLLTHLSDGPFVAIPVFPSRLFRHTGIYLGPSSPGPRSPGSLAGGRVGLAEYQLTANVWMRGILAEHHDLPVASVRYRTGGLNAPGRTEKFHISLPPEIDIEPVSPGQTLSGLLAAGELDAVYSPRAPDSFGQGQVRRLFADSRAEEEKYFAQTGIFPIMHVVVIHRRVYDRHPWLAQELLKAFTRAKELAYEDLASTVALNVTLPFIREEFEAAVAAMGPDYWSYGLDRNRATLTTFIRYAREQGLVRAAVDPADLFAPETTAQVVI